MKNKFCLSFQPFLQWKINFVCDFKHLVSPNSGRSRIFHRRGMDLIGGGVDSQGSYISKILYVKMKELGPLGGGVLGTPP